MLRASDQLLRALRRVRKAKAIHFAATSNGGVDITMKAEEEPPSYRSRSVSLPGKELTLTKPGDASAKVRPEHQVVPTFDKRHAKMLTTHEHSQLSDRQILPVESLPTNFHQLGLLLDSLPSPTANSSTLGPTSNQEMPLSEFANHSEALKFLIDFGVSLPDLEEFGKSYLTDGTFAHEFLYQDEFERRHQEVLVHAYKKYSFLFRLEKGHIERTVHFLMHNLGLEYDSVPKILSSSIELLEIIGMGTTSSLQASSISNISSFDGDITLQERRDTMVKIVAYLQKLGLDREILSGVGSRCLLEFTSIDDFDYLIYKLSKINNLESKSPEPLRLKKSQVSKILLAVPEILAPSHFALNEIDRTMQLVSRHLISDNKMIRKLLLALPRELFFDRIDDPQHRLLGQVQANWKMLTFDFLLQPADICNNFTDILACDEKFLKYRLYFLKSKNKTQLMYKLAIPTEEHKGRILVLKVPDDGEFCDLIGEDVADFENFKNTFFL